MFPYAIRRQTVDHGDTGGRHVPRIGRRSRHLLRSLFGISSRPRRTFRIGEPRIRRGRRSPSGLWRMAPQTPGATGIRCCNHAGPTTERRVQQGRCSSPRPTLVSQDARHGHFVRLRGAGRRRGDPERSPGHYRLHRVRDPRLCPSARRNCRWRRRILDPGTVGCQDQVILAIQNTRTRRVTDSNTSPRRDLNDRSRLLAYFAVETALFLAFSEAGPPRWKRLLVAACK